MLYKPEYTIETPKMTFFQKILANLSQSYRASLYPPISQERQDEIDRLDREEGMCGEIRYALEYEFRTGRDLFNDMNKSALWFVLYLSIIGIIIYSLFCLIHG